MTHVRQPGTALAIMQSRSANRLVQVAPGSPCVADACGAHHEEISGPRTSTLGRCGLHAIDSAGLVHAIRLGIQIARMPFRLPVQGGH